MLKIINYFLQSILIYLFFLVGRLLGLKISRKVFTFLFSKVGPFFKSKKTIQKNLKIFSKTNVIKNEKQIINNMWRNYGSTFIEYIFLDYFKKNNFHITYEGKENLPISPQKDKPVIFVSGHFANFELMSMEITKNKIPLATIYRPLNNIFLNPFMEFLRKKYICKHQIKKGINGVRDSIKFIKSNYSVALMIDQRVSEGEIVNFFGKPALTTTLPAQLSIKFDLDIVPVFIKRENNNKFRIKFHKRVNPKNFKSKLDLTQELNSILEKMIISNPDQWIWTHNR